MHDWTIDADSLADRVRAFATRAGLDHGLAVEDREDLAQDLLYRLHRRTALLALPVGAFRRVLEQGLANFFRDRSRRRRRPAGALLPISSVAGWEPIDRGFDPVSVVHLDLDWPAMLAPFGRREVRLVRRWRDNDWRRPRGLSREQRRRFDRLRLKLAERLTELGYFPTGGES